MNAEEQLRQSRETKQVTHKSLVKSKIISLVMLAIAATCAIFGYEQQLEAKANRDEVIKLHREIKRLKEESEAARVEASKLRSLIEMEKRRTETALKEMQSKK